MNLDELEKFNKPVSGTGYPTALTKAQTPRKNPQRKKSGSVSKSYLGFDAVADLEGASAGSNLQLLAEVQKLETKTADMTVAGEALRRKATNLAQQGVIRSTTIQHILSEAEKLAIAQNAENTAVGDFLSKIALSNTKADNSEAYTAHTGRVAFDDENANFAERVRKLYSGVKLKAVSFVEAGRIAEQQKARKALETSVQKWIEGKGDTTEALHALDALKGDRSKGNEKSVLGSLGKLAKDTFGL